MSDIEDMLVADVRSLENELSKERLRAYNWEQSARTRSAEADRLAKDLGEAVAKLAAIEKRCVDYVDQESGPGIPPGVRRGLEMATDVLSILIAGQEKPV